MKHFVYTILLLLKSLLILWVPILLVEETFLFNYVGPVGSLIISVILSILCLIMYIKTYKKIKKEKKNYYLYNIFNAILFIIFNLTLGYFFINLIDLKIFHHCVGSGWDCFLFGIEYLIIGFEYAFLSAIILVIWLFVRLIKFLKNKLKNS